MRDHHQHLIQILNSKLLEIRRKNPRFSLRGFAKKAGVSSGTMSSLLQGNRSASPKLVEKMANNLLFDPQERSEVMPTKIDIKNKPKKDNSYIQLSIDQFAAISEWHYFAILNLMKTKNFCEDPKWIGQRINIPASRVSSALSRLIRLGFIIKDNKGKLKRSNNQIRTTDGIENLAIKKAHSENLNLAEDALFEIPLAFRDFSFITLPFDPAKIKLAKQLIRKFQDEFTQIIQKKSKLKEVYRFSFQLFPLTKIDQEYDHE